MIRYSVLIPQRDAGEQAARLVPRLDRLLASWGQPYELLVIDDASGGESWQHLEHLRPQHACLRLLRLDRPGGLSAALTAGMAAARGELVITLEASEQYLPEQIPWLVERLSRADLVFGRRHGTRAAKLAMALAQLPRRLLLGLEVRDPDCLFWAARREALAGIELTPGLHRFLGSLVSTRGFRVAEIHVDHDPAAAYRLGREAWPSLGNLLFTWWQRRKWRACAIQEAGVAEPLPGSSVLRIDPPQALLPPTATPSVIRDDDRAAA